MIDLLGLVMTPQGVVDVLARGVVAGTSVGVLFIILTLFYGRSRA